MQLDQVRDLQGTEQGIAVVTSSRQDGTVQATVVNCGILGHPVGDGEVVAWVSRSNTAKLDNYRARPRASVTFRRGWQWATVEGPVELVGPDDDLDGFDDQRLPELLRDVFRSAGGTHDDWDAFDEVMRREHRAAVLVRPERVYSNPS